jgi:sulfatase modifying factor 1
MKRIYLSILIICGLGFGSTQPKPTARHPGALSARTSVRYNTSMDKFWFLRYDGFEEDKVTIGNYSFDKLVTSEKKTQRRKFDSLDTRDFGTIQPPSCVHLTKNLFIDDAEITNIDYQEFLFYVKRDSSQERFIPRKC